MLSKAVVINGSNPASGISLHWSPASLYTKWKAFLCLHLKNFNPKGRFMVCSEHFTEDSCKRLFHMEGNVRRLQPRSIPTIWRKSEKLAWTSYKTYYTFVCFGTRLENCASMSRELFTPRVPWILLAYMRFLCFANRCYILFCR